jgi:hypothetical protein
MISWILNKYQDWKFERDFQKRKAELMRIDPFIYHLPSETEDHPGAEPTRYKTWESKGKEIDF